MAKGSRMYSRRQGKTGEVRFYGDFREYADVGGGQEALKAPGMTQATTDKAIAETVLAARLKELTEQRRYKTVLGVERHAALAEFARDHLVKKKKTGKFTDAWLSKTQKRLEKAVAFFGHDRELASISPKEIGLWVDHLRTTPGRNGIERLSEATLRHYLNALSNVYKRAGSEGVVSPGFNPVAALMEKPVGRPVEAHWMEVHEAAALLAAAKNAQATRRDGIDCIFPILATLLLTGGRLAEVLGLEVSDINSKRGLVRFRPNKWRRLKNQKSARSVPLWPQLDEILSEYVAAASLNALLFPSRRTTEESMITDLRKSISAIARDAGLDPAKVGPKVLRHTYCTARLQTLDNGEPVAVWTVANEMGHTGTHMIERTYGHLGKIRHRGEGVEYVLDFPRRELDVKDVGVTT